MPTPYDGKIAVWHVYGGMCAETTIAQIAGTLQQYAPAVSAVFVKVADGADWMGKYEPKPDLAINSTADIDRWVATLSAYNLDFHAWAVPKGRYPAQEAALLTQICQRPGVKSLILDVEGGAGFYGGGQAGVRPYLLQLRQGLPSPFHIGLSVDPRPNHYNDIFSAEWFPFVDSVHPQVYWSVFGQTPDAALKDAYTTWGSYRRPLIPVLQAYQVNPDSMNRARSLAVSSYNAPAVSWYVFGSIGVSQFKAVNVSIAGTTSPITPEPPPIGGTGSYGIEIIVKPGDPAYRDGAYNNAPLPLQSFDDGFGGMAKFGATQPAVSTAWARWDPQLPAGGTWEVSAFVPSQHATTNRARFKIHGIVGHADDFEIDLRQKPVDSLWASLGVYNFVAGNPTAGVVLLNNLTGENGAEIAFDAIRWRQVLGLQHVPPYLADGYDSPLGTSVERKTETLWPSEWVTSNPYDNYYPLGPGDSNPAYHTGDDIVAKAGEAATAHQPIFAAASGVVVSASQQVGSWGNVIVIRHDPLISSGQVLYTRYSHIETMQVAPGDRVTRGEYIANVGNAFGRFIYHLHFDLSPTNILQSRPWDWPGLDRARLEANYIDPFQFIGSNRPAKP